MAATERSEQPSDTAQGSTRVRRGGGPVFLPHRRPSALARQLLSQPWEGERITPYDEQWSSASTMT